MILEAENLHKSFPGHPPIEVLKGVFLQIQPNETIAIMGKSGEGKSTLLQILGTLDSPSSGYVKICGQLLCKQNLANLRNTFFGFIFQSYHLLEEFSVLDNVLMPAKIARAQRKKQDAQALLAEVNMLEKQHVLAKFLSGGEKQRVAIARALCNQPSLLLADEPTGNLDQTTSKQIQQLLLTKAKQMQKALILVTHDQEFANQCDRVLFLKEGQLYNAQE